MITWTMPNQNMDLLPLVRDGEDLSEHSIRFAAEGDAGQERDEHDRKTIDARSDNNGEYPGPEDFVAQGAKPAHPDSPEDQFIGQETAFAVLHRGPITGRR
jgi:hypothetical protein